MKGKLALVMLAVMFFGCPLGIFALDLAKAAQGDNADKAGALSVRSSVALGESDYQPTRVASPAYAQTTQNGAEKKKFPDFIDICLIMGIAIMSIADQKPLAFMLFIALVMKVLR